MEMAVFEILFSQGAQAWKSTCVSIKWLGWLQLGGPKGRQRSQHANSVGGLLPVKRHCRNCASVLYITRRI
jgi:hypothetical protein